MTHETVPLVLLDPKTLQPAHPNYVSPNNTVGGDCGTSTLTMTNQGNGHALFNQALHSSMGAIVQINRVVSWDNTTVGFSGQFGTPFWIFPVTELN